MTPFAPTAPSAPASVSATAGNESAQVAWSASTSNGGSPITGYTVTALVSGNPTGITGTACATCTGASVIGLTNGVTYTFTVHATNAIGNSAESAQSNAITPAAAAGTPDVSITDVGPSSVNLGANATYTITVNNTSLNAAPSVMVTDTFPATGATFVSATASQGVCSAVGSTVTCTLGTIAGGGTASI
ncbi:MAG TPA: fibronectin type III domain-containing protein, partial [Candidatus Angelobacter sp.]|nr:fibronectin type III domain-containing protein [Candidatus Angelobacter sp.]